MSDIICKCPVCSMRLAVGEAMRGTTHECPHCRNSWLVPEASDTFRCPSCDAELRCTEEARGGRVRCPSCSKEIPIPESSASPVRPLTLRPGLQSIPPPPSSVPVAAPSPEPLPPSPLKAGGVVAATVGSAGAPTPSAQASAIPAAAPAPDAAADPSGLHLSKFKFKDETATTDAPESLRERYPQPKGPGMLSWLGRQVWRVAKVAIVCGVILAPIYLINFGSAAALPAWRDAVNALNVLSASPSAASAIHDLETAVAVAVDVKTNRPARPAESYQVLRKIDLDAEAGLLAALALSNIIGGNTPRGLVQRDVFLRAFPGSPYAAFLNDNTIYTTCEVCRGKGSRVCPACGGTGKCPECHGKGVRERAQVGGLSASAPHSTTGASGSRTVRRLGSTPNSSEAHAMGGGSTEMKCVSCGGTGKCRECNGLGYFPNECPACHGTGKVLAMSKIKAALSKALALAQPAAEKKLKEQQIRAFLLGLQAKVKHTAAALPQKILPASLAIASTNAPAHPAPVAAPAHSNAATLVEAAVPGAQIFNLRLDGSEQRYGPYQYTDGARVGKDPNWYVVSPNADGTFALKSFSSGNEYGPFKFEDGAKLQLGRALFEVEFVKQNAPSPPTPSTEP